MSANPKRPTPKTAADLIPLLHRRAPMPLGEIFLQLDRLRAARLRLASRP